MSPDRSVHCIASHQFSTTGGSSGNPIRFLRHEPREHRRLGCRTGGLLTDTLGSAEPEMQRKKR